MGNRALRENKSGIQKKVGERLNLHGDKYLTKETKLWPVIGLLQSPGLRAGPFLSDLIEFENKLVGVA